VSTETDKPVAEVTEAKEATKDTAATKEVVRKKKSGKREVPHAHAHVQCSFNNTIITIADPAGGVVAWSSAGKRGFRGARKSTPFAAQVAAEDCGRIAGDNGVRTVAVFVNGPGAGRESALRGLQSAGLRITYIRDVTPIPHNGCRPPKKRRV
jgi:small subunit ribosomal protein S11